MDIKAKIIDLKEYHINYEIQKLYSILVYEIEYTKLYGIDMWKKINFGDVDKIIRDHLSEKIKGDIKFLNFRADINSAQFIYKVIIKFDELLIKKN